MTLCPIALAVGCKKCPAFSFCPVKTVLGDSPKPEDSGPSTPATKKNARKTKGSGKRS